MTTIEHALLGINGTLAAGLHRRWGWPIVALAGVAAVSPDWDGVFLVSRSISLVEGHRVWGHNLLACTLIGVLLGLADYHVDLVTRCGRRLVRLLRLTVPMDQLDVREQFPRVGLVTWILVAVVAALSHLPADMVISGTDQLPDWKLQVLWPFSHRGWVFPLMPWGHPGITIVFVIGMFAMVRWRSRLQLVACLTLAAVVTYLAIHPLIAR